LVERQADALGKDDERDASQYVSRKAALAGAGALGHNHLFLFVEPQRRGRDAAPACHLADREKLGHDRRLNGAALDFKFTLACSLRASRAGRRRMHARERTALITGASRGLGLALARGLAGRGWNLILTARDAERLSAVRDELARQTHVAAIAGDVTHANHRAAMAVLARGHAGLDAIVNNAGALGPSPLPPLLEYPLDALRSVLDANVIAPLGMLQAVRDVLKPGARLLSITSDAAVQPYAG